MAIDYNIDTDEESEVDDLLQQPQQDGDDVFDTLDDDTEDMEYDDDEDDEEYSIADTKAAFNILSKEDYEVIKKMVKEVGGDKVLAFEVFRSEKFINNRDTIFMKLLLVSFTVGNKKITKKMTEEELAKYNKNLAVANARQVILSEEVEKVSIREYFERMPAVQARYIARVRRALSPKGTNKHTMNIVKLLKKVIWIREMQRSRLTTKMATKLTLKTIIDSNKKIRNVNKLKGLLDEY